jgi:hypothetical protein
VAGAAAAEGDGRAAPWSAQVRDAEFAVPTATLLSGAGGSARGASL